MDSNKRNDLKKSCGIEDFNRLIYELTSCGDFRQLSFDDVSENCHNVRYRFSAGQDKLSVVYDTKARILNLNALPAVLKKVENIVWPGGGGRTDSKATGSEYDQQRKAADYGRNDIKPEVDGILKEKHFKPIVRNCTGNAAGRTEKQAEFGVSSISVEFDSAGISGQAARSDGKVPPAKSAGVTKNSGAKTGAAGVAARGSKTGGEVKKTVGAPAAVKKPLSASTQSEQGGINGEEPPVKTFKNKANPSKINVKNTKKAGSVIEKASLKNVAGEFRVKDIKDNFTVKKASENVLPESKNAANKKSANSSSDEKSGDALPEYKNGFSVKKFPQASLDEIIKEIKKNKGCSVKESKEKDTRCFAVTDSEKQKALIRYAVKSQTLQLQGKRSPLFTELQILISRGSDYKTVVNSLIELTGSDKKAGAIERELKKKLPSAFEYLSEQAKSDLTIGFIDINNEQTRLSDYSSLLTPPYRGLEKLISDLQKAQGISVKMIGQAYEREDGEHVLKAGYRRKINSVVYAEVMSSLYSEYYARRNFYLHSDNSEQSVQRIITDKAEVVRIFDSLLYMINYNCKKLQEIRFSL